MILDLIISDENIGTDKMVQFGNCYMHMEDYKNAEKYYLMAADKSNNDAILFLGKYN